MIDLTGKAFCEFGLRGTGKSTLADLILESYNDKALYYDTVWEAPKDADFDIYRPKNRYSVFEFETVIRAIVPQNINQLPKYRLFIVDEANRFCPSKPAHLPDAVADLNDQCRHYLMTVGYIARRPSQLNQDLTELADYLFIFKLTGKNDITYLNNLVTNLGETVLSLGEYEFVIVYPDRTYSISQPVKPSELWLNNAAKLIKR